MPSPEEGRRRPRKVERAEGGTGWLAWNLGVMFWIENLGRGFEVWYSPIALENRMTDLGGIGSDRGYFDVIFSSQETAAHFLDNVLDLPKDVEKDAWWALVAKWGGKAGVMEREADETMATWSRTWRSKPRRTLKILELLSWIFRGARS